MYEEQGGVRGQRQRRWLLGCGPLAFVALLTLLAGCRGFRSEPPQATASSASAGIAAQPNLALDQAALAHRWVVDAAEARSLIVQGATLLDARGPSRRSIDGAIAITWQQFSEPQLPRRGNLLGDLARLTQRLQAVGLGRDRPVVVFGDPLQGWGEEGRIVWMLRALGHAQAVFVDGGYAALVAADLPSGKARSMAPSPGDFVPAAVPRWQVDQAELQAMLSGDSGPHGGASNDLVLIDTREPREYAGATPYGEARGGHLPGAVNLHFSQLLDGQGYLLPEQQIRDRLASLGITAQSPIVAYCTGGIRSGWLTAVLLDLGYDAQNYAGSLWEWAAEDGATHPLELF